MTGKIWLMLVAAPLLLLAWGCCTDCEDCPPPPTPPPSGIPIIIRPGSTMLSWEQPEGTVLNEGPTILDSGDTDAYCNLRWDLIGNKFYTFEYSDGSTISPAENIQMESDDFIVQVSKNALDQLQWTLIDKSDSSTPCGTALLPIDPAAEIEVPAELFAMTTIQEVSDPGSPVDVKELKIWVYTP